MKLYAIITKGSGTLLRYEGTQADAKSAARDLEAKWEQVEVPTDKTGLIAHLNSLCGQTDGTPVAAAPEGHTPDEAREYRAGVKAVVANAERRLSMIGDLTEGDPYSQQCKRNAQSHLRRIICSGTALLDGCEASRDEFHSLIEGTSQ